jgi:hypothetical protein
LRAFNKGEEECNSWFVFGSQIFTRNIKEKLSKIKK